MLPGRVCSNVGLHCSFKRMTRPTPTKSTTHPPEKGILYKLYSVAAQQYGQRRRGGKNITRWCRSSSVDSLSLPRNHLLLTGSELLLSIPVLVLCTTSYPLLCMSRAAVVVVALCNPRLRSLPGRQSFPQLVVESSSSCSTSPSP